MSVEIYDRKAWLEKHRSVKTLWHHVAIGRRTLDSVNIWPESAMLDGCDAHQREQWSKATTGAVGILGGSPGTGKTFTVASGVRAIIATGLVDPQLIGIGAPTGKAAVRLTEQLQAAGLDMRARTWHSLLGVGAADGEFKHNRRNPLPHRVLIGDESSMLATDMMRSIFAARARGCHFLLVGDVNQLPPVNHGAPLRDLIAAGLPYGELTEIKRNSGGIVEACAAIRDGKAWVCGDNLKLLHTSAPQEQLETVVAVSHRVGSMGLDPIWDSQVLVAVNAKSKVSRAAINAVLQEQLNPNGQGMKGCSFRVKDKIVNTKNGYFTAIDTDANPDDITQNERGEVYVANGELGEVIAIEDKLLIVRLSGPVRVVKVPRGPVSTRAKSADDDSDAERETSESGDDKPTATGCSWELGYALSVHKSQGSEVPVAIVVLDEYPGARMICDRSWLYTAISRAKRKCILVGAKATADAMCRRANIGKRKTFLRELVLSGLADCAMKGL